jgi:hypothetical protein
MIKCPVCLAENSDFATVCLNCKAFLQDRIPNVNFFETAWKVIESPQVAFRRIVLSEHKNFSLFLFSFFGISLSFTAFWYFRLGNRFFSLLDVIQWALISGVAAGLASAIFLTLVYHVAARAFGGRARIRDSMGLLAYALVPIVISLFLVLPIELLTFGMYLFTSNPSPYSIKPFSFVLLAGFDALVAVWTVVLSVVATRVGHRLSVVKSVAVVALTLVVFAGALFVAASQLHLFPSV